MIKNLVHFATHCMCIVYLAFSGVALSEGQLHGGFNKLKGRIVRSLDVAPFNSSIIIAGNKSSEPGDGKVFISRDGGLRWRFLNANKSLHPAATDVQAVAFLSETIVLAGTWKYGLYRSTDGGQNFKAHAELPDRDIRGFAQTKSGVVLAATGSKGVFRSDDDGLSWTQTQISEKFIWSIHSNGDGSELLASSPGGGLHHMQSTGVSRLLSNKTYQATSNADFTTIAAATEDGLFVSKDSGGSWVQPESLKGVRLSSVRFKRTDPDVLLIGSWQSGVWEYSLSRKSVNRIGPELPVLHLYESIDAVVVASWGKGIHIYPHSTSSRYLVEATKAKDHNVVIELLGAGAESNSHDAQRNTALIFASRDGYLEIAKTLIDSGADTNWVDGEGVTPLILASLKNHLALVKLLLANGANTEFVDGFGRTATDYAKRRGGDDQILQLLNAK